MYRVPIFAVLFPYLFALSLNGFACDLEILVPQIKEQYLKGEYQKALDIVDQALPCSNDTNQLILKLFQFESLRNGHKYQKALATALEARELWEKTASPALDLPTYLALAEAYSFLGNGTQVGVLLPQISEYTQKAVSKEQEIRITFLRAYNYIFGYDSEPGVSLCNDLLIALDETAPIQLFWKGQTFRLLGRYSRYMGDFHKSKQYFEQELQLYQQHYLPTHFDIAVCHYNIANVHYEMLEFQQALDHYLQAFPIWETQFAPEDRYYRFLTEAIGDMYWELQNRPKALEFYNRSVEGAPPSNRDSSLMMTSGADTLLEDGKTNEALYYYEQALAFRKRNFGQEHPLTAACQNFVGKAHVLAGRDTLALEAYQQSILMLVSTFSDTSLFSNPKPDQHTRSIQYLLEALAAKGRLLLDRAKKTGDQQTLNAALETLQLGVYYLEQYQISPMSDASKLFWNDQSLPLLEHTIQASLLLYEQTGSQTYLENAFYLAEKSKAFLLLSAFQEDYVEQYSGIPSSLLKEERKLKKEILDYQHKIVREERKCEQAQQNQIELWAEKLRSLETGYGQLINQLQHTYPRYFNLKYRIQPASIQMLQASLEQQHTALIEFFEGEQNFYCFYIDKTRIKVVVTEKNKPFLNRVLYPFSTLTQTPVFLLEDPSSSFRSFQDLSYSLFDYFLKEPLSYCSKDIQKLLIIPSKSLASIPVGCLLTKPSDLEERAYHKLPYVLNSYACFYAPSATVWQETVNNPSNQKQKNVYIGFAPDYQSFYGYHPFNDQPLLHSTSEVQNAQKLFNGLSFTGARATEQRFREQQAQIVHLAAHATLDDDSPLLSKLYLLPEDSTEDGILHAYEIYGLDLNNQLALLSACQTASGNYQQGEGIMSLERAFFYAGCSSLLSTFWAADDRSTAQLSHLFLKNIKAGMDKSVALQKAKQEFLASGDPALLPPFYWAGLRLAGDTTPITPKASWISWVIAFLGLSIIGWQFYQRIKPQE